LPVFGVTPEAGAVLFFAGVCGAGLRAAEFARENFRNMTMEDVSQMAEHMPWGTPDEVTERIIAIAEHAGANSIQISLNRGVLPQELFLEQIRRFAKDVLPKLQAHNVQRVRLVED